MTGRKSRVRRRLEALDVGQQTRLAALAALVLSIGSAIISIGLLWAIWWNNSELRRAAIIPTMTEDFDAVAAAAAVGRLDILTGLLTFVGIIAALALVYGLTAFRTAAIKAALEEVDRQLPQELAERMAADGHILIAAALKDDELVARLQARFTSLGLDDIDDAVQVDTDPDWKETGNVQ